MTGFDLICISLDVLTLTFAHCDGTEILAYLAEVPRDWDGVQIFIEEHAATFTKQGS